MPDSPPGPEFRVSSDKVVERLCRDPLGQALWRAAVAEEMVAVLEDQNTAYRNRVDQLTAQKSPAVRPPASTDPTQKFAGPASGAHAE